MLKKHFTRSVPCEFVYGNGLVGAFDKYGVTNRGALPARYCMMPHWGVELSVCKKISALLWRTTTLLLWKLVIGYSSFL